MALKRLHTEEMLQISGSWVDVKTKSHKAIIANPDLAPSMPRVSAAHGELATLAQPVSDDGRLAQIIREEVSTDVRHDDIVRGVHGLLTSAAVLLGADGADLLTLRDTLLPEGLQTMLKT